MLPRFSDPDIFPSLGSVSRSPLPSTGSRRVGSPASSVLRGSLTPRRPSRPTPVSLAWRYRLCVRLVRSRGAWTPPDRGPGSLVSRDPHRLLLRRKRRGLPGSWGDPPGPMPCSLTPAGPSPPGHTAARVLSRPDNTGTTPTTRAFRGSITRPQPSLSTLRRRPCGISPRKTRLQLVASLCRAGFAPAGSPPRGFRSAGYCLHGFLPSQASLAHIARHLLPAPRELCFDPFLTVAVRS